MTIPKVSIIIPAYNAMTFLPKTLESVFNQTFQDYELIIVNDGSSDDIEEWAKTILDSRFRLISQANQGQSVARNTGITQSRGEYIAFLDSDDLWATTKLEKQVQVLEKNPEVGLVYTWVALIDEQEQFLPKVWETDLEGNVWTKLIGGNIIACGSVPMIRRSCIEKVGLFKKFSFGCEDWDLWLRISLEYPFKVIKEILVYYRSVAVSASRAHTKNYIKNMEQSYFQMLESAFDSAASHLQHLKSSSYARAYLQIAWTTLNKPNHNCQDATRFQNQAIFYDPELSKSHDYKRLKLAIMLVSWLGYQNYTKIKNSTRWLESTKNMLASTKLWLTRSVKK